MTKSPNLDTSDHYDFDTAIVGAGCAGLTLANGLSKAEDMSIAIIDGKTNHHDHFWGFWDNGDKAFDIARELCQKSWNRWSVRSHRAEIIHEGQNSTYRALTLKNFEKKVWKNLKSNHRLHCFTANVIDAKRGPERTYLQLENGSHISAKTVFDSRPASLKDEVLLQHFLGLKIQSEKKIFDPSTAILMDFRVSQEEGIHFIYLLPFTEQVALVESTVFSERPMTPAWYKKNIRKYLIDYYACQDFIIHSSESGIIPMCFSSVNSSIGIPIGIRAGALRASSGFAFSQIQTQISKLICSIEKDTPLTVKPGCDTFEKIMDEVMLRVISKQPNNSEEIFIKIFQALNGDQLAEFMRGYSSWSTRLRLIFKLPKYQFLRSLVR